MERVTKKYEPTISDLEWLVSEFRKNNGEAELAVLLEEIIGNINKIPLTETKKDPSIPLSEAGQSSLLKETEENFLESVKFNFANFYTNIPKAKKTSDALKKIRDYSTLIIKNKYFKKASIFIGLYLFIYLILNSPMYFERIKYVFEKNNTVTVLTEEIVKTPMANSAPIEVGEVVPEKGTKLLIPKINVDVPIVSATSQDEKLIQEDLKKGVVQYAGTAKPGQVGNSFIVGHSSGYFWDNSQFKYAFVLLDKLEPGDKAKIYKNGRKFVYEVTEKKIIEPTDVSVLKQTDEPTLSLMTCYPPGSTSKRLIVKLKQIAPEYIKPKVILKEKEITVPKSLPSSDNGSVLNKLFYFFK